MEIEDAEARKKRRRSKWDAPAASTSDGSESSSSVVAAGQLVTQTQVALIAQQQAADKAQLLYAQQALAQTMAVKAPIAVPVAVQAASSSQAKLDCRIYVGSLHYNISDADIRALFSPFGVITKVDMSMDPATGRSKGFCFVEFSEQSSAVASLEMNQFDIGGRKIKVGRPSGASNTPTAAPVLSVPTAAPGNGVLALISSGAINNAKTQAQILLSQAMGDSSTSTAAAPLQHKSVVVRNVRTEINAAELHAVLLPFGNIVFCNFIGQESTVTVLTGVISVRSALIEYKSGACASECCSNMNGFSLGGVYLLCDMVDQSTATALKGDIQTVVIHREPVEPKKPTGKKENLHKKEKQEKDDKEKIEKIEKKDKDKNKNKDDGNPENNTKCTVILENLVTFEEASDPSLKGEIANEAEKHGDLKDIEILVDQKKTVRISLTYYESDDALKSFTAMNGRFFGGRTVTAILLP